MSAVATTGVISRSGNRRTYQAGAAAMQRGLVAVQGADDQHVLIAAAAGAQGIGIVEESTVNAGDPISIVFEGEAYAVVGAPVNAGQYLVSDNQGRVVPSAAAGDQVICRAVSSGALANDEIVVYVNPFIR